MIKANEPIIIPDHCWTKEQIHDQMDTDTIEASDISDEDAIWWVKRERAIAFEAIFNGEDYYGRKVAEINGNIIQRTLRNI
jgi:hypothetical protein